VLLFCLPSPHGEIQRIHRGNDYICILIFSRRANTKITVLSMPKRRFNIIFVWISAKINSYIAEFVLCKLRDVTFLDVNAVLKNTGQAGQTSFMSVSPELLIDMWAFWHPERVSAIPSPSVRLSGRLDVRPSCAICACVMLKLWCTQDISTHYKSCRAARAVECCSSAQGSVEVCLFSKVT